MADGGTPSGHPCNACGAEDARQRCGKCKIQYYCNRECQLLAWKSGHQHSCGKSNPTNMEELAVQYEDALTTEVLPTNAPGNDDDDDVDWDELDRLELEDKFMDAVHGLFSCLRHCLEQLKRPADILFKLDAEATPQSHMQPLLKVLCPVLRLLLPEMQRIEAWHESAQAQFSAASNMTSHSAAMVCKACGEKNAFIIGPDSTINLCAHCGASVDAPTEQALEDLSEQIDNQKIALTCRLICTLAQDEARSLLRSYTVALDVLIKKPADALIKPQPQGSWGHFEPSLTATSGSSGIQPSLWNACMLPAQLLLQLAQHATPLSESISAVKDQLRAERLVAEDVSAACAAIVSLTTSRKLSRLVKEWLVQAEKLGMADTSAGADSKDHAGDGNGDNGGSSGSSGNNGTSGPQGQPPHEPQDGARDDGASGDKDGDTTNINGAGGDGKGGGSGLSDGAETPNSRPTQSYRTKFVAENGPNLIHSLSRSSLGLDPDRERDVCDAQALIEKEFQIIRRASQASTPVSTPAVKPFAMSMPSVSLYELSRDNDKAVSPASDDRWADDGELDQSQQVISELREELEQEAQAAENAERRLREVTERLSKAESGRQAAVEQALFAQQELGAQREQIERAMTMVQDLQRKNAALLTDQAETSRLLSEGHTSKAQLQQRIHELEEQIIQEQRKSRVVIADCATLSKKLEAVQKKLVVAEAASQQPEVQDGATQTDLAPDPVRPIMRSVTVQSIADTTHTQTQTEVKETSAAIEVQTVASCLSNESVEVQTDDHQTQRPVADAMQTEDVKNQEMPQNLRTSESQTEPVESQSTPLPSVETTRMKSVRPQSASTTPEFPPALRSRSPNVTPSQLFTVAGFPLPSLGSSPGTARPAHGLTRSATSPAMVVENTDKYLSQLGVRVPVRSSPTQSPPQRSDQSAGAQARARAARERAQRGWAAEDADDRGDEHSEIKSIELGSPNEQHVTTPAVFRQHRNQSLRTRNDMELESALEDSPAFFRRGEDTERSFTSVQSTSANESPLASRSVDTSPSGYAQVDAYTPERPSSSRLPTRLTESPYTAGNKENVLYLKHQLQQEQTRQQLLRQKMLSLRVRKHQETLERAEQQIRAHAEAQKQQQQQQQQQQQRRRASPLPGGAVNGTVDSTPPSRYSPTTVQRADASITNSRSASLYSPNSYSIVSRPAPGYAQGHSLSRVTGDNRMSSEGQREEMPHSQGLKHSSSFSSFERLRQPGLTAAVQNTTQYPLHSRQEPDTWHQGSFQQPVASAHAFVVKTSASMDSLPASAMQSTSYAASFMPPVVHSRSYDFGTLDSSMHVERNINSKQQAAGAGGKVVPVGAPDQRVRTQQLIDFAASHGQRRMSFGRANGVGNNTSTAFTHRT